MFTNIDSIPIIEGIKKENNEVFSEEEAILEAKRCSQCQCLECVKACPFMAHYKSYPKKYAIEIYNNISIAIGRHHANGLINTCNTCSQCEAISPNGLNMSEVFLAARSIMVDSKKMPPSAHEFAMLDMAFSNSENYYLGTHQKGFEESKYVFFPSCQLGASEPELLEAIYGDLCNKLESGIGLFLSCCSIMAKWAGEDRIFNDNIKQLQNTWEQLGKPEVIVACPTCYKTLKEEAGMNTKGIWELFNDNNYTVPLVGEGKKLAVYDACGTRYEETIQKDIRLLTIGMGYELSELKYSQSTSPCCGYGGLTPFVNKDLANEITENRIKQTSEAFLTYCINCRDRFIKEDKEAYHILELMYHQVPVRREAPTWSMRQDNRVNIKDRLLKNIWGKEIMEEEQLELYMSENLEDLLDERMILRRNINDAITHGEITNEKFCDSNTGYITTAYKSKNVTFGLFIDQKRRATKLLMPTVIE